MIEALLIVSHESLVMTSNIWTRNDALLKIELPAAIYYFQYDLHLWLIDLQIIEQTEYSFHFLPNLRHKLYMLKKIQLLNEIEDIT